MRTINKWFVLCVTGLLASGLVACAAYETHSGLGTETTLILTRHAERTVFTGILTKKGHARAKALVDILGDKNITAIYSPDLVRNLDTAKPLAKHLNIDITTVGSNPDSPKVVKTILSQHSGEVVLWVGNTSNLSEIYSQLGGEGDGPVHYGDLYFMKIKDRGEPEIVKTHYGTQ